MRSPSIPSTSITNDAKNRPSNRRMARLARLPRSESASVPHKETRQGTRQDTSNDASKATSKDDPNGASSDPDASNDASGGGPNDDSDDPDDPDDPDDDSLKDKIQTACENIIDHFRELSHESHRVWPRFKQLEASFVDPVTSTIDPSTLRSYLPRQTVSILLAASPEDVFTVTNRRYVGKVRKAAALWDLDPKHLLFHTVFDYGNQGEGFFTALHTLATRDHDWPRCRSALQACVVDRRQLRELPQISRRDTSLTFRKGIIESDVRTVISRLPPPPPPPQPPSLTRPSPRPRPRPSRDQSQAVTEPPSAPTEATEQGQASREPEDELEQDTDNTPERAREADRRHSPPMFTPPPRAPIQSSASSHAPLCATFVAVEAEEPSTPDNQLNTADDSDLDESGVDDLIDDGFIPNDFLADLSCIVGASGVDNDSPIDNDPPQTLTVEVGDQEIESFKADTKAETYRQTGRADAGGAVPETSSRYRQQPTSSHLYPDGAAAIGRKRMSPTAKRPRLNLAVAGSAHDAQKIMEEDSWITDQQLMHAITPMCDTSQSGADGVGVMVVESLESQKMARDGYVLRQSMLCRVSKVALILLPLHLGNNHWALATISKRGYAATSLKLFDALPSDHRTTQARDLILAFVKHYLWDTPPRARVVLPCASPRQTNNSDCGVFTFAFALFKAANLDLPATLDSTLWRRIMAGCLHNGSSSSDMSSLVPKPTYSAPSPRASEATTLTLPQRMKKLSDELKRMKAEHANDMRRCTDALCGVSLATQALDDMVSSMTSNIEGLEGRLKAVKMLERANGLDHTGTRKRGDDRFSDDDLPSAIRLATLLERVRETRERTDNMLAAVARLRDDTQRVYDEMEEGREGTGDDDSLAME